MKIVIIGAGLAGLACAEYLQNLQANAEIIILEGRDRIGGRVTKSDNFDLALDLGASWIHDVKGNPLTSIAKRLELVLDVTENPNLTSEGGFEIYTSSGAPVNKELEHNTRAKFEKVIDQACQFLKVLEEDFSVEKAITEGMKRLPNEMRDMKDDEKNFIAWLKSGIEGWENANLSMLSARYHFLEWEGGLPLGGDGFIISGFWNIPIDLAKNLNDKILLQHEVHRIEYNDEGCVIETSQGKVAADYVVCTVPLGVLKGGSIAFSPGLPAEKSKAIHYLGMGLMNKLVFEFEEVFWRENIEGIGYVTENPDENFNFFLNLYPLIKRPILMCFVTADFARKVEEFADEKIVDIITAIFSKIYPGRRTRPIRYKITRWGSDRFSQGSYSFRTVGSTKEDIENLAKPVGRLHFAGEATYVDMGFAHGAYLSGRRAAAEIVAASRKPTTSHHKHVTSMRRPSI